MTVEEIKKALAGGFQQMNTSKTEHGPYEYDRNAELQRTDYIKYYLDLDEQHHRRGKSKFWYWAVLVFAGAVLWKVWVG